MLQDAMHILVTVSDNKHVIANAGPADSGRGVFLAYRCKVPNGHRQPGL